MIAKTILRNTINLNVSLRFNSLIIRQTINLVNKDLQHHLGIDLVYVPQSCMQLLHGLSVLVLRIQHENDSTTFTKDFLAIKSRIEIVKLARKVPNLKLNKRAEEEGRDQLKTKNMNTSSSSEEFFFFLDLNGPKKNIWHSTLTTHRSCTLLWCFPETVILFEQHWLRFFFFFFSFF